MSAPGLLLSVLCVASAVVWFGLTLADRALMAASFSRTSYYLILGLVLLWSSALIRCAWAHGLKARHVLRSYGAGFLFSLALAALVFVSVPPTFRILSDETNMLAVSKSMLYEQRVENVTQAKRFFGIFTPIFRDTEKRPLLFPFLTHILHVMTGFRPWNPFVLNFLALCALFCALFILLRKHLGAVFACSCLLLVAAQPIVSLCATSGGFELLSVLFMLLSFMSLKAFLENPGPVRFQVLWLTLMMLANTRYECMAVFGLTMAALVMLGRFRWDWLKTSWAYALTPLVLLPAFWQRVLMMGRYEQPPGTPLFSLNSLADHNILFFRNLFNFTLPFANVINALGIVSLLYFAREFYLSKKTDDDKKQLVLISAGNVLVLWIIITAHFFGRMDHVASSRLFLLYPILLSLGFGMLMFRFRRLWKRPANFLLAAAALFLFYHPIAVKDRITKQLYWHREHAAVLDFLKNRESENFLIIAEKPGQYTAFDYGAVHFSNANIAKGQILLEYKRHLYDAIYVVQEIQYASSSPTAGTRLDADYRLETQWERQNTPESFIRISRVVRPI